MVSLSGLVVACRTAVPEDPGSNSTADGCIYHDSYCDIQANSASYLGEKEYFI